jgi:epoxyqueuosine reductase
VKERLIAEIRRFVAECPENRQEDGQTPYFGTPLIAFAAADDPLFDRYREVVCPDHLSPLAFLEDLGADPQQGGTVVCWSLPIVEPTRQSNRPESQWPSRPWARTRQFGEAFNVSLRRHVTAFLTNAGYRAVAPQLSPLWREIADGGNAPLSTWSERHAAYAAGLGTFSLNDALITPHGIAHRLGTVITDLLLSPSHRPYANHTANCLHFPNGECGLCIERCPVGAISSAGHDKKRCRDYVYGNVPQEVGERFGVKTAGCGLCQTGVPCEAGIPRPGDPA